MRIINSIYSFLGVIVVALAAILVSILALKIPVVPVCLIIVLEAGIAVCLHDVPIWLHGLVVLVQIIAGAICGKLILWCYAHWFM